MNDPRIFEINKINKIPNNIPYLLGIAYFFGFLIVNSYLSDFNFYSINLLNTEYLIAGIIFSLIFGTLFFSIYYSNKKPDQITDNEYDFALPALLRIFIITFVISLFTIDYKNTESIIVKIINFSGILYVLYISLLNSKYIVRKLNNAIRWGLIFLYIIAANIFVFYNSESSRALMTISFISGIGILIILSYIIEKKFHKVQIIGLIFISITLATLFGTFVYEKIPKKYGGGKPYKTELIINKEKLPELKELMPLKNDLYLGVEVLFETEQEFLIKKDSTIFILNKSFFSGTKNLK